MIQDQMHLKNTPFDDYLTSLMFCLRGCLSSSACHARPTLGALGAFLANVSKPYRIPKAIAGKGRSLTSALIGDGFVLQLNS
jgi:hypothetical protein